MQAARHAVEADETLRFRHAPIGGLRIGRLRAAQDVRGIHRHRLHRAAARLQRHGAVDAFLRSLDVGLEIGLQRLVEEALVHQLGPFRADRGLEAVLRLGQDALLQRAVGDVQGGQSRRLVHDAALEPDRGIAGVEAAAHAIARELAVQPRQDRRAIHRLAVQRHGFATLEADRDAQRLRRPLLARRAPAARALARRFPAVDLAAGQGEAQHVLVDRVGLLLRTHFEAALLQPALLVGPHLRVLLLDLADRRHDHIVAQGLDGDVEAHLVVAHAGAAVGEMPGAQRIAPLERFLHDEVPVRDQQRVLALVPLPGAHQRLDEFVPDRLRGVDGAVLDRAQFLRALLDVVAFLRADTAGVAEQRVHGVAALDQPRHAEAGVEAAGEGEDDFPGVHDPNSG